MGPYQDNRRYITRHAFVRGKIQDQMSQEPGIDPLTPGEREEFEEGLISFCDHQLHLLGEIQSLDVLYAGGSSLLWIEGLCQRIGRGGSLTVLDMDEDAIEYTRERLTESDAALSVDFVTGDIFAPPLEDGSFDLAYSAGLFHELDIAEEPAEDALGALVRLVRRGGRVATTDFIDSFPAAQIEDERIRDALVYELSGRRLFGIGPPERLCALHEGSLKDASRRILPPHPVPHLEKVVLAEEEPEGLRLLPPEVQNRLRGRREALKGRIRREGYTRPATLYVEGRVADDVSGEEGQEVLAG